MCWRRIAGVESWKSIISVAESQIMTLLILNCCERLKETEKEAYEVLKRERMELTIEEMEHNRRSYRRNEKRNL